MHTSRPILSTTGLLLLGVEHTLTLGNIADLFQFVPYLGPIFSAMPALLVGLTISPQMTLYNEIYQKEILHATNPKAHTQANDPTIH